MPNLQLLTASGDRERDQPSPWRSFGSVTSALLARAEARRTNDSPAEDYDSAPVAWAAE